jgi:SAM-dependent methyltransferase
MGTSRRWQLDGSAAERYLEVLEPAILGPVAEALVTHVAPRVGARVIDIGCGTGAAALKASELVGRTGRVVGVDINRQMIEVARSRPAPQFAEVEWLEASAMDIPLPDGVFDTAVSSQVLQFVDEPERAMEEARRVLRPGGLVGVGLWCPLDSNPYFSNLVASISEHIDSNTAGGLGAAFSFSDEHRIRRLLVAAGFEEVSITTATIHSDLPPLGEFVPRHIGATPMAAGYLAASPEDQERVIRHVEAELQSFSSGGRCRVPFLSYFATGVRRAS